MLSADLILKNSFAVTCLCIVFSIITNVCFQNDNNMALYYTLLRNESGLSVIQITLLVGKMCGTSENMNHYQKISAFGITDSSALRDVAGTPHWGHWAATRFKL